MSKKNYSTTKSQFVQKRMNEGKSNQQARKEWTKSDERKQFNEFDNIPEFKGNGDNIDRSYGSPMQDWAETSDDL